MKTLTKGECFGCFEVICNSNRITDAIAKEKTHLLTIPVFWLKNLYGDNYRSVLVISLIKVALLHDYYFSCLFYFPLCCLYYLLICLIY